MNDRVNDQRAALRKELAEVRAALVDDMRSTTRRVRELSDWRYYLRKFPWLVTGVAALAGFLVLPGHRRQAANASARMRPPPATGWKGLVEKVRQFGQGWFGGAVRSALPLSLGRAIGPLLYQWLGRKSPRVPPEPRYVP